MKDIFKLPIHEHANIFPMMTEADLADLADDIKAHGQHLPIVVTKVDGKLMLVDGRNRRAACQIAEVKPEVRELDGEDVAAFILSTDQRRSITKGQRAMQWAMIYPDAEKGGRGKKASVSDGFSATRLSNARTVFRHLPDEARLVVRGVLKLDEAYANARASVSSTASDEIKLDGLRSEYPDLADQVGEDDLTFDEANAAAKVRRQAEHEQRQVIYRAASEALFHSSAFDNDDFLALIQACLDSPEYRKELRGKIHDDDLAALMESALSGIKKLLKVLKNSEVENGA